MREENKILKIIIAILIVMELILCFEGMRLLGKDNEFVKKISEQEAVIETQEQLISDLKENCKDLYVENQKLKFGGE